jgi:hypothetical protein
MSDSTSWRSLVQLLLLLGFLGAGTWTAYQYAQTEPTLSPDDYPSRIDEILKTTPLIDGHNDLPYLIRLELKNKVYDTSKFTFRDGRLSRPFFSFTHVFYTDVCSPGQPHRP